MRLLTLAFVVAIVCRPPLSSCEKPVNADSIADNIGVDLHLHYNDTTYGNFPLVKSLLTRLGIRHVRDGMADTSWQTYYEEFVDLGKIGIKGIFITSPSQSDTFLTSWPKRVPGAFEGYEAPNEYDNSGDAHWADTLNGFVARLFRAVKSNPATAKFAVIGPSLIHPTDYQAVAQLSPYFDTTNLHNYFGGRNPGTLGWGDNGYGSITYNIGLTSVWPGHSLVTTETGYNTGPGETPEDIEGMYEPRIILEQALHGVHRTYLYELLDEPQVKDPKERDFGLARGDGSPKPAFVALQNLIVLLTDLGPASQQPSLEFSLTGGSKSMHHLLMAKRDGSYYLAFWLETQDFDVDRHIRTFPRPEHVSFHTDRKFATSELIKFHADGSVQKTQITTGSTLLLTATNCVSILHFN